MLEIIFISVLSIWSIYLYTKPLYNWDMLAYMGVIVEYEGNTPQQVHAKVYESLRNEVSIDDFQLLISTDYRYNCYSNYCDFHDELKLYRVKPLYTYLAYGFYSLGLPLTKVTYILSILSYWGIVLLVFYWLRKEIGVTYGFVLALLIIFFNPLTTMARLSTPDALSNLIIASIFYLFYYDKRSLLIYLLLFISVFVRIDNIIYAAVFVFVKELKIPVKDFSEFTKLSFLRIGVAILISSGLLVILITTIVGNSLDWLMKFSHIFTFSGYFKSLLSVVKGFSFYSSLPIFAGIVVVIFRNTNQKVIAIIIISAITILLRLLVFPSFQERFFVAFEVVSYVMVTFHIIELRNLRRVAYSDTERNIS